MKKCGTRFAGLLLLLVLAFSLLPATVFGAEQRVFDEAGLLTEEQIAQLERSIQTIREEISMDLVVVTTNDTQGKTTRAFADDYYDSGNFGMGPKLTGALLLIDMDNRQAYISTTGDSIDYLNDARIDQLLDSITDKLKGQDYYGAAHVFLMQTEHFTLAGKPEDGYRYDESTGPHSDDKYHYPETVNKTRTFPSLKNILIFLAVSLGVGLISAGGVAAKYKFGYKASTYPVRENSRMRMKNQQDIFLHRHITTRVIQDDDNNHHSSGGGSGYSGGGSATHTSSSGTTHGGGGRGF